ncbi:MAG: SEL1-like repeat protein [Xanthomonadaceae bacterium]|nr:SEL1-like repeat protein [Xanthomonadaceae bacterium]MDE2053931.1 sel1 repeat family protein [Xanthomonadaceae bacterium]MDE2497947.1 sel1 repeat family protein [Xanthomonadaceae bacterium]
MMKSLAFLIAVLPGMIATMTCLSVQAQTPRAAEAVAAPDYGSDASAGSLSNGNFNTPESDGRPGVYYFNLGVQAFKKGDYRHAIDMYKVAASWAYKPAEYNLAIMYFKGQGVPVDRARGAAWMVLAAERGDPLYIKARDLMITALTKAAFARTDEIWNQLKPTYGDAVALRRAKARWAQVKAATTGSRVGAAASEYLMVGGTPVAPSTHGSNPSTGAIGAPPAVTGWGVFKGALVTDGSVAYRQFQQSDNPYDPVFLKGRSGTVTVEGLTPLKSDSAKQPPDKNGAKPPSSGSLE